MNTSMFRDTTESHSYNGAEMAVYGTLYFLMFATVVFLMTSSSPTNESGFNVDKKDSISNAEIEMSSDAFLREIMDREEETVLEQHRSPFSINDHQEEFETEDEQDSVKLLEGGKHLREETDF